MIPYTLCFPIISEIAHCLENDSFVRQREIGFDDRRTIRPVVKLFHVSQYTKCRATGTKTLNNNDHNQVF